MRGTKLRPLIVLFCFFSVHLSYGSGVIHDEILVKGGTFSMGSSHQGYPHERPIHSVTLDSFYMMKTEVIFDQYDAFSQATGADLPDAGGWGRGTRPVINVSWYDAVEYANWLSKQDGLTPVYDIEGTDVGWDRTANGWRLPTETEWEYAARGGHKSDSGYFAGSNDINLVAWFKDNSGRMTQPVAGKQANKIGLYDLSGNVSEWCWDWYGPYQESTETNPIGPASGTGRVLRGGNWRTRPAHTRITDRDDTVPSFRLNEYGFRLVRTKSRAR